MKRLIPILIFAAVLFGCKKEKDTKQNPCATPDFYINTSSGAAEVNITSYGVHGFYEIEYGNNGFSKGSGTTITVSGTNQINNLTDGTYDIYLRGNCGGTQWSDWSAPKSCLIQGNPVNTCATPNNLTVSTFGSYDLRWEHPGADYYEVEYGPSGFTIGSGTKETTNNKWLYNGSFAANTAYEFYVRAYCGNGQWSNWSSAKSFYATKNQLMCLTPTNISVDYSGGSTVTFNWDDNGEAEWETSLLSFNGTPGSGTIFLKSTPTITYGSINTSNTYYFYVRAVCKDGSRTVWFGPKVW